MAKREDPNTIILGSGNLYFAEYDTTVGLPKRADLCKEENRLGYIKGGASLEYNAESTVVSDDLQKVSVTKISSSDATFKSGILTWNGIVLSAICSSATVDETTEEGFRHVKLGGAGSDNGESYALCFHHSDPEDGDIWLMMRAKGSGTFEITFSQDDGSALDTEFTCLSSDNNGTLIHYIEQTSEKEEEDVTTYVKLEDFQKNNICEEINESKTGNQYSKNAGNTGYYDSENKKYVLNNISGNESPNQWVYKKTYEITGKHYISFNYQTNSSSMGLGYILDGDYVLKSFTADSSGSEGKFVLEVEPEATFQFYEIRVAGSDKHTEIYNLELYTQADYLKTFASFGEFILLNDDYIVCPEMFGATGDGISDDTVPLQNAINYAAESGKKFVGGSGKTYLITEPIDIKPNTKYAWGGATVKAGERMDYMFTFDGSASSDNSVRTYFSDITIDCAFMAGGFDFVYSFKFDLYRFKIIHCSTTGINVQAGGSLVVTNGTIIGNCASGSVGINILTSDCHFSEITLVDMIKAIYNAGTVFYHRVHAWLTGEVAGSLFFEHMAGYASLHQCQCDTYETGYLIKTSNDLCLTNCTYYNNSHLYDSSETPVCFKYNSGISPFARRTCCNNCSFNSPNLQAVLSSPSDAQITFNGYTHFTNMTGEDTVSRTTPTLSSSYLTLEGLTTGKNSVHWDGTNCQYDLTAKFVNTLSNASLYNVAFINSPYYPKEDVVAVGFLSKSENGSDMLPVKVSILHDGNVKVRIPGTDTMPADKIANYVYFTLSATWKPKEIGN